MRKWDDVKFLYYNIAGRYKRYYPEFDIDELVNEAWIMTYPYIDEEHLPARIHRRIMGYIRRQILTYRLDNIYHKVSLNSIDEKFENLGETDKEDFLIAINNEYNIVEIQDYINEMARKLNKEEKIILILKYEYNCSLYNIGRIFNLSDEAIRQKLKIIFKKMKGKEK